MWIANKKQITFFKDENHGAADDVDDNDKRMSETDTNNVINKVCKNSNKKLLT